MIFAKVSGILGVIIGIGGLVAFKAMGYSNTVLITWISAGVLIAFWGWMDRKDIIEISQARSTKYGVGAGFLVIIALAITVATNILAIRYDKRWDLTSTKQFTLSEQTLSTLANLTKDVQVIAFFPAGSSEESSFKDLIAGYESASSKLKVELHDPYREPTLSLQYQITTELGTVILVSGQDKQRLETTFDEESLTNAIVKLTSGVTHEVCFTIDHGELSSSDDQDPSALGWAAKKLQDQNYTTSEISILQKGKVPESCDALIIGSPRVDFLPVEREAVAAYIKAGGKAFYMLEPLEVEATTQDLARYGIGLKQDLVIEDNPDARMMGLDPSFIMVPPTNLDHHSITNKISSLVIFQVARSVAKLESSPEGLNIQELAFATDSAWAETTLDGSTPAEPTEGLDIVGHVPLVVAVEVTDPESVKVGDIDLVISEGPEVVLEGETTSETPVISKAGGKLVVVGDASFASNQFLFQQQNQDLFLNTVAWLVGEEGQLTIRPNESAKGSLTMSLAQGILLWFASIMLFPALAVIGAVVTWLKRRKL